MPSGPPLAITGPSAPTDMQSGGGKGSLSVWAARSTATACPWAHLTRTALLSGMPPAYLTIAGRVYRWTDNRVVGAAR